MTRVLVYATKAIARAGLESIIRSHSGFELVGSAANLTDLMQLDRDDNPMLFY